MHDHSNILPLVGILALAVGPLVYWLAGGRRWAMQAIDGFVLTSVGGLVVLFVMPAALAASGGLAIVAALVGMTLPLVMERLLGVASRTAHSIMLVSALIGLVIHTTLDGVALFEGGHTEESAALALAVVLHRLPVSLAIWSIVKPRYGRTGAAAVLGIVALGTLVGAGLGHQLYGFGGVWFQLFQAMVAGSLLHVVVHRHDHHSGSKRPEAVGGMMGMAVLLVVPLMIGAQGHSHGEVSILVRLLDLSLDAAPALVLGFGLAAALGTQFRRPPVRWLLGGGPLQRAVRGMAVGLPLPVCSCGVVPLYHSLIRAGVPASAAMAFLVATPEIGIESFMLSVPLLGLKLTMWRVAVAALIAVLAGAVVGRFVPTRSRGAEISTSLKGTRWRRFLSSLRSLTDDTGPWLVAGLILGSVVEPAVVSGLLGLPGAVEVLLFAAVGVPVYVCASGATPLAAAFVWAGVSPGAALAFLMAGPATNVTTFAMLTQLHGKKIALGFASLVLGLSVAAGLSVNAFGGIQVLSRASHAEGHPWWAWGCLAVFVVVAMDSLVRLGPSEWVSAVLNFGHDHNHDHGHSKPAHPLLVKQPAGAKVLSLTSDGFKVVAEKNESRCCEHCD